MECSTWRSFLKTAMILEVTLVDELFDGGRVQRAEARTVSTEYDWNWDGCFGREHWITGVNRLAPMLSFG